MYNDTLKFGTKEWADENYNFINGCSHDCKYCYSKEMAIRFRRKTILNWKEEEIRNTFSLNNIKLRKGIIMFPSSHDITPKYLDEATNILSKLLIVGNKVLLVTKPHRTCIERICSLFGNYRDMLIFRFTIGSSKTDILKFWEPGAPSFEERVNCLEYAYARGFQTSVSCEPLLDNEPEKLVDLLLPYVTESIWLGKANYLCRRLKINGESDQETLEKAKELNDWQGNDERILTLVEKYNNNPKIEWKESIKKVILSKEMDKGCLV